jgi:hypothetical protein
MEFSVFPLNSPLIRDRFDDLISMKYREPSGSSELDCSDLRKDNGHFVHDMFQATSLACVE